MEDLQTKAASLQPDSDLIATPPITTVPIEGDSSQNRALVTIQGSYASLVDPEKITKLQFRPASAINGIKCAKPGMEDVQSKIDCWQNAILCSVLGGNPPFERIWASFELDKILQIRRGVFLVRFVHLQDKMQVRKRGIYCFDRKPFLLPGLNIKYWSPECLSKICSILGYLIKTDKYTRDHNMIHYARVLIEVPLEGPYPNFIEFFNEQDILVRQPIKFEWIPCKCTHCTMFGHEESVCKKKGNTRKEWRRIGLVGLLEVKVKEKNVVTVAMKTFPGWKWAHNFAANVKGRIWVAWKPNAYDLEVLQVAKQLIHFRALQLSTTKTFNITMVYGFNRAHQRTQLWANLQTISLGLAGAWCIIGDFNAIMYKDDRMGGDDLTDTELNKMQTMLDHCELQEMRSAGAFYSWTNKVVRSRIDRAFINDLWHETFDFTQVTYMANGLSDHTPLLVQFPSSPKPSTKFQFCDMWAKHKEFPSLIAPLLSSHETHTLRSLYAFLARLRPLLKRLNKRHFSNFTQQQANARDTLSSIQQLLQAKSDDTDLQAKEKEQRERYIAILTSIISLLQQQSKMEWIQYGDEGSRLFFAKAKQQKLATYIYTIKYDFGNIVEGFECVGKVMQKFYTSLLGQSGPARTAIDREVMKEGPHLTMEQELSLCLPFTNSEI
ncbi:LOW QUALITY PROTEIN: hypothetical protein Cgig2_007178 [Carnegiea gigantea]|uniref:Endonuclease/exonuclease/phosphatase domain-containing protein n=1 Tax=Carnegiea gigantea TaxID=171969 RepID=A0A9Q1GMY8_9CARY|nr:LOW QUALITY PROTEIN: hypothetical protein Cgig2_007178 [Carnegiea gigantea]